MIFDLIGPVLFALVVFGILVGFLVDASIDMDPWHARAFILGSVTLYWVIVFFLLSSHTEVPMLPRRY